MEGAFPVSPLDARQAVRGFIRSILHPKYRDVSYFRELSLLVRFSSVHACAILLSEDDPYYILYISRYAFWSKFQSFLNKIG